MFPLTYFVKKFVISPSCVICNNISWHWWSLCSSGFLLNCFSQGFHTKWGSSVNSGSSVPPASPNLNLTYSGGNALIWSCDSRDKSIRIKIIMAKIYTFKLIKLLLNNLKVLDYSTVCFDQSHIGKYWSSCQVKTLQKLSGREKTKFGFCKVRVIRSRVKLEQLCNENAEDIDCGSSARDVRVSYGLNLWTLRVTGI